MQGHEIADDLGAKTPGQKAVMYSVFAAMMVLGMFSAVTAVADLLGQPTHWASKALALVAAVFVTVVAGHITLQLGDSMAKAKQASQAAQEQPDTDLVL